MAPGSCTRLSLRQSILIHTNDATFKFFFFGYTYLHLVCGCDKIGSDFAHAGSLSYLSRFLYDHLDILKSYIR